ncbi:MAG TPA: hypothetical protein DCY89_04525 [Gammaproteobacteria bacterium]|nr:hypothetical protein [Gammaproteobacteria bacterium]
MSAVSLSDVAALGGAVLLAAAGGEAFLRGVLGAAAWLRLPKLLVATTLAAFATSCPEFIVSTLAALSGEPEIGLGNVLGANVVNLTLIVGTALLIAPLRLNPAELGRDFLLALGLPLLIVGLALDGSIDRGNGLMLLTIFTGWLALLVRYALTNGRRAHAADPNPSVTSGPAMALLYGGVGLASLLLCGHLFVTGASGIATALGIAPFIIGATVVAVGTAMPEFVTMILSRLRGQDDVGVGTVLGSVLFNGLAIIGTAATIHPIAATPLAMAPTVGVAILALLLLIPGPSRLLGRARGLLLLATYAGFVALKLGI